MSTEEQAVDRSWNELLQELRVTQTGLQILTGFLVTLPFQQRFATLDTMQTIIYLCTLSVAVVATILVLAPASFHRLLFRQQKKEWLVLAGNVCARSGLLLSGFALTGVTWLLFDVVVLRWVGLLAGAVAVVLFVTIWWVVPVVAHRRGVLASTPGRSPRSAHDLPPPGQ